MSSQKSTLFAQVYSAKAIATSFTTAVTDVGRYDNISYEIIFANATNTPSGFFTVQGADAGMILPNQTMQGATWTNLPLSAVPQVDSSSGSHLISLNQIPFRYIRILYTPNSGVADITVNVQGREL